MGRQIIYSWQFDTARHAVARSIGLLKGESGSEVMSFGTKRVGYVASKNGDIL